MGKSNSKLSRYPYLQTQQDAVDRAMKLKRWQKYRHIKQIPSKSKDFYIHEVTTGRHS
jgi:hypothetical protein